MVLTYTQSSTQSQGRAQEINDSSDRQKRKYDHLLKPVKNIAQSWGIDIAKELSDYAASLNVSFDSGISSFIDKDDGLRVDFAEAALLLQGSTSIYCRKVEHLYTLVLSAVETLNTVKSRTSKGSSGSSGDNDEADDDEVVWNVDDIDFLQLDDVIPMADEKQISVKEPDCSKLRIRANDPTLLVEVPPLLRVPKNCDASVNGNGMIRMNLGIMDESGTLFLRGATEFSFDLSDPTANDTMQTPMKLGTPQNLAFEDDDDDNGSSGLSPELLRQEASPLPFQMDDNVPSLGFYDNVIDAERNYRPWDVQSNQGPVQKQVPCAKVDPFEELDPHNDMGMQPRPNGTKSRIVLPQAQKPIIWRAPSLCASKATVSEEHAAMNLVDKVLGKLPRSCNLRRHVSFAALRAPAAKMARKIATAKRMRATAAGNVISYTKKAMSHEKFDDFSGDNFEDDAHSCDDDEAFVNDEEEGGLDPLMSLGTPDDLRLFGTDIHDGDEIAGLETGSELQNIVNGYQQKCLQYMRKTSLLWEKQGVNADIRERVEKWSARIRPKLEEEDKRPVYDIQACGTNVLRRLYKLEEDKRSGEDAFEIKTVLQSSNQYDVCRVFLATLQLANNYDVEICSRDASTTLKLLDTERAAAIRRPPLAELTPSFRVDNANAVHEKSGLKLLPRKPVDPETADYIFSESRSASGNKRSRRSIEVSTAGRRRVRARTRTFLR